MTRRSRVREVVLQILYEDDLNPQRNLAVSERFLYSRLRYDQAAVDFGKSLLAGVRRNRAELDALLQSKVENWSLERMAVTDRNVLRLGAYELLHTNIPDRVAINEAVELAKRYGAKQSSQFVNGILDRVLRDRVPATPPVRLNAT